MPSFHNLCDTCCALHCFQGITFTKVNSCYPSLSLYIYWVVCGCFYFLLSIKPYMVNCMYCPYKYIFNLFKTSPASSFIPGKYSVTFLYFFNSCIPMLCGDKGIPCKAPALFLCIHVLINFFYTVKTAFQNLMTVCLTSLHQSSSYPAGCLVFFPHPHTF